MLPDFNRLHVFFHIYRTRSVSAAAKASAVTQSAVSQTLAKLERELDVQLFVRRHRALVPTPASTILFGVVAPFVEALQGGVEEIRNTRHELAGVLRVGAPVEFGARRLPQRLATFRQAHAGVSVELRLGHPSQIVPQVLAGELDLAFTDVFDSGASGWAGLDVVPIAEEQLILVGTRRLEKRRLGGRRGFRELSACPFVAYHPTAPALRGWFRHHFGKAPARPTITLAVESVQAVLAAIEQDMGLGLLPAPSVADALARGRLVAVTTRRRAMTSRIALTRLLDKVPSRIEREFVRFIEGSEW
ncbi:MAG: LysR family transcriptional regulator [Myxococcota bacterium]